MEKEDKIDYEKLPEKAGHPGDVQIGKQTLTEEESDEVKQQYADKLIKTLY